MSFNTRLQGRRDGLLLLALMASLLSAQTSSAGQVTCGPIQEVRFSGNAALSEEALGESLQFSKPGSRYDESRLAYDLEVNLLGLYRENGYLRAQTKETLFEILSEPSARERGSRQRMSRSRCVVTIEISEGLQYRFGSVSVEGWHETSPAIEVGKAFGLAPGTIVNMRAVEAAENGLRRSYQSMGYLDAEVESRSIIHESSKTAELLLLVDEGRQYIVGRIEFVGLSRVSDPIVRKAFLLEEQTAFNLLLLEASLDNLNRLGQFKRIESWHLRLEKRARKSEVDVIVQLTEKSDDPG